MTTNKTFPITSVIILTLFFSLFLGFNNGNVYAIEDYTVTLNWDNVSDLTLCGGNSGRNCSDYSYFISHPTGSCSGGTPALIVSGLNGDSNNQYINVCSDIIAPLNSTSILYLTGGRNLPARYSGNLVLTLTDSFGSTVTGNIDITNNGTFDVASYATATVNVPVAEVIEDPISNDFQKVFFKIVEKIIPAFGILLVVWFGIDMLSSLIFGRGR